MCFIHTFTKKYCVLSKNDGNIFLTMTNNEIKQLNCEEYIHDELFEQIINIELKKKDPPNLKNIMSHLLPIDRV